MKPLIEGLTTMGRHAFQVQCKGEEQMAVWLNRTTEVHLSAGRRFFGAEAGDLDITKRGFFKIFLSNIPNALPDELVYSKFKQYGEPDFSKRSERDVIKGGKWKDFQNGDRAYYMKTITSPLGMPQGFRLRGLWIRCRHYGQVRGEERDRRTGRWPSEPGRFRRKEKEGQGKKEEGGSAKETMVPMEGGDGPPTRGES